MHTWMVQSCRIGPALPQQLMPSSPLHLHRHKQVWSVCLVVITQSKRKRIRSWLVGLCWIFVTLNRSYIRGLQADGLITALMLSCHFYSLIETGCTDLQSFVRGNANLMMQRCSRGRTVALPSISTASLKPVMSRSRLRTTAHLRHSGLQGITLYKRVALYVTVSLTLHLCPPACNKPYPCSTTSCS